KTELVVQLQQRIAGGWRGGRHSVEKALWSKPGRFLANSKRTLISAQCLAATPARQPALAAPGSRCSRGRRRRRR
nr:hypothetical protein [Tanacetum cinerariifolium]